MIKMTTRIAHNEDWLFFFINAGNEKKILAKIKSVIYINDTNEK
ncbi:hypothetical protein LDI01_05120 [Lentilactobacillus diolivorans]|uniref:Uncharacterized protein n=1 Tax=Lentilactobacillus diolivorans TaxID=179838 RepID=A0ABQ0XB82_9LACO|nr:hypothetical protein LDI01_05120 [Lentilactobacillus diolivorans]